MKRLLIILAAMAAMQPALFAQLPYSVAHRGGHIDGFVPENSVAGVAMAARYGFRAFECDVHYTKDSVMILMHDGTINRTCRTADTYQPIEQPVRYRDLTFEELRSRYVLASDDPSLRTPVPTFAEIVAACKEYGIIPMMHTDLEEAYAYAYQELGDGFIAFDTSYEAMKKARAISSGCRILWDPGRTPADETVAALRALGGPCGISSMKADLLVSDYVGKIRAAGFEVQDSIFPSPKEIDGIAEGASIVLSDFSLFARPDRRDCCRKGGTKASCPVVPGKDMHFSWDRTEYGSLEMDITVTGSVEVTVNGRYSYIISGKGVHRIGGWRFYDEAPSVHIAALEASSVDCLELTVFAY